MSNGADERIDFISDYCDRRCERCQFTARCSLVACTVSIAMCGDVREGIQLAELSWRYIEAARQWIDAHESALASDASDPVLHKAGAIATQHSIFFIAKVHRALHGRDRSGSIDDPWDDPAQNDWNGSAKVALLSLQRSRMAWQTIAEPRSTLRQRHLLAWPPT
jgi:hypothetical protein